MGIYSNYNTADSYVDDGSYTPRDLFAECGETSTYEELSLAMVAESEQNYNAIMKAIGLNEVNYFAENGEEIIYEAGGISGVLTKIKEFFKKLIEKIRQILHTFVAKMSSIASNDSNFVQKYQKEFSTKWSNVKSDWEFNGFVFTIDIAKSVTRADMKGEYLKVMNKELKKGGKMASKDVIDKVANGDVSDFTSATEAIAEALKKTVEDLDDTKEDAEEDIRGSVANDWTSMTSSKVIPDAPLTASEFSKELYEAYRNGESSKEGIEKSKLSVAEIVSDVKDADKFTRAANKACKAAENGLKDIIKVLDRLEKNLVKGQSGEMMKGIKNSDTKKNVSNTMSYILAIISKVNDGMKFASNCYVQANGIYLQAITDRKNQAKAIMVKVIGQSKKMTESYDYNDYGYEDGSSAKYFDSVVLK